MLAIVLAKMPQDELAHPLDVLPEPAEESGAEESAAEKLAAEGRSGQRPTRSPPGSDGAAAVAAARGVSPGRRRYPVRA